MIEEVKMYTVICDNCGVDSNEDSEYSCWNDKDTAWDTASEQDWIKENGKHYFTNCYSYDDNDNLIIKANS